MADHTLLNQIIAAEVDDEEVYELYQDLKQLFDNPFDTQINEAITLRKCAYVEIAQPFAN